jgi:hypothetical protein
MLNAPSYQATSTTSPIDGYPIRNWLVDQRAPPSNANEYHHPVSVTPAMPLSSGQLFHINPTQTPSYANSSDVLQFPLSDWVRICLIAAY